MAFQTRLEFNLPNLVKIKTNKKLSTVTLHFFNFRSPRPSKSKSLCNFGIFIASGSQRIASSFDRILDQFYGRRMAAAFTATGRSDCWAEDDVSGIRIHEHQWGANLDSLCHYDWPCCSCKIVLRLKNGGRLHCNGLTMTHRPEYRPWNAGQGIPSTVYRQRKTGHGHGQEQARSRSL